jgi:MFS family permease
LSTSISRFSIKSSLFYSDTLMVSAAFIIFVTGMGMQSAFGIFFTPMLNEFGWNKAMTSGAFSICFLVSGAVGVIMGRMCDRIGSRRVLILSGILLGAGYLMISQITSAWQFYIFYGFFIGAGMAAIWVPVMSSIAKRFVKKRNLMTAIVMTGGGIGSLVGPPLANLFIETYEWRGAYIILGSLTGALIILSAQFLRNNVSPGENGNSAEGAEKRVNIDHLKKDLNLLESWRTRQFWMQFMDMFCIGFCAYVVIIHVAPEVIDMGFSPEVAANILATSGGTAIISRLVLASIAGRIGNRNVLTIGFILMTLSVLWFISADTVIALFLASAVFGLGFGGGVANSPLTAEIFGVSSHGVILGVVNVSYCLGSAAGPFMAGLIFDSTGSYHIPFLICAIVGLAGLVSARLITPLSD